MTTDRIAELSAEVEGLKRELAMAVARIHEPLTNDGWMLACLQAREQRDKLQSSLTAKEEKNKKLREALEPFANEAFGREWMPDYYELWIRAGDDSGMGMLDVTITNLRHAHNLLHPTQETPPKPVCSVWKSLSLHGNCRDCGHPKEAHT